jgi:NDP-sugar pyrophosphorylase family protein
MGTRLRSVLPSTPKPLAPVRDRPFLELLVRQLRHQGIRHLVMCTGHLAGQIETQFGNGSPLDVEITYSREPGPLGTAGAVKHAPCFLQDSSDFLVMNGDSFLETDFHELISFHRRSRAFVTLAVVHQENAQRYGTVQLDPDGRVTGFLEKAGSQAPGLVNAGVYVFDRAVLDYIPETPASLEKDVFPQLLSRGLYGLRQHGAFIDIGTPEDYARAQIVYDRLRDAALSR